MPSPAERCQVLPAQPSQIQVAQKVARRECSVLGRHQLLSHIDPHCITLLAVHCHSRNDENLLRGPFFSPPKESKLLLAVSPHGQAKTMHPQLRSLKLVLNWAGLRVPL